MAFEQLFDTLVGILVDEKLFNAVFGERAVLFYKGEMC
jgi:hypothetical protein